MIFLREVTDRRCEHPLTDCPSDGYEKVPLSAFNDSRYSPGAAIISERVALISHNGWRSQNRTDGAPIDIGIIIH
jgi:hypothetical protein